MENESNPYSRPKSSQAETGSSTVAYCQECGRPLSTTSIQRVAEGIFCSPCMMQRQAAAAGWRAMNAPVPPHTGRPTGTATGPRPAAAATLGLIPGVGAMYNGQYAKGALHLIVFVVILSAADNLNWVFFWFVWGWVFYQAFDAYHTAVARRDGLPLPNPFGWNDIGERFGFHRNPPSSAARQPEPTPMTTSPAEPGAREYAVPKTPPWQTPAARVSVEPSMPASAFAEPLRAAHRMPGAEQAVPAYMANVPYSSTYTGVQGPVTSTQNASPSSRFPVGALWLIGLGLVFLSGNLFPALLLRGRWLVPLLLAAVAIWTAFRRWEQYRVTAELTGASPASLVSSMMGPCLFLAVAFLLSLDAADVLALHRSWPLLLVIWGALLMVRRAAPLGQRDVEMPFVPAAQPGPRVPEARSAGL